MSPYTETIRLIVNAYDEGKISEREMWDSIAKLLEMRVQWLDMLKLVHKS